MAAKKQADSSADLRTNEKKWTKPLIDAGWTALHPASPCRSAIIRSVRQSSARRSPSVGLSVAHLTKVAHPSATIGTSRCRAALPGGRLAPAAVLGAAAERLKTSKLKA